MRVTDDTNKSIEEMDMKKILLILGVTLLQACASTGPAIGTTEFTAALSESDEIGETVMAFEGDWWPDTILSGGASILGNPDPWHNPSHTGQLIFTENSAHFVIWDDRLKAFHTITKFEFSEVNSVISDRHGAAQILVIYREDKLSSFTFNAKERAALHDYLNAKSVTVLEV